MSEYHVNPSTEQVFVVDSETGETLTRYAGLHFQLLDDGRILYMDNGPHGFSDVAYYSVAVDGEIIYTSPESRLRHCLCLIMGQNLPLWSNFGTGCNGTNPDRGYFGG